MLTITAITVAVILLTAGAFYVGRQVGEASGRKVINSAIMQASNNKVFEDYMDALVVVACYVDLLYERINAERAGAIISEYLQSKVDNAAEENVVS